MLTKLFNVILLSGVIPDSWSSGWIVPIYKKKGSEIDPNNYRGISLINCICKVFTSLISSRITRFCDSIELLGSEQAGFRRGFSTCDHIFSLHVLITIYTKVLKKKLYCCYVDYRKAFDSVPRIYLWYKLLAYGINGKIFNIVKGLYAKAKSAIKQNNHHSAFFGCDIGVRQGDNLSPLLFALYLNDLQDHLANAYNGLSSSSRLIQDTVQDEDTVVYLKLFTILYADDTVIFAESRDELQAALHGMNHYCNIWKLDINAQKTKVVIYGNRVGRKEPSYKIGNHVISVESEYTYLGINFPSNINMGKGISLLRNQASRAMFALIKKSRKLGLDVDVQLQLFDSVVLPIALYGCELWGFRNLEILEKLHLQYCKIILNVKKCTTSAMVYGELGRLPLEYNVKCRMLGFWFKMVCGKNSKISCILYNLVYNLHTQNRFTYVWIDQIKSILLECDMGDVWYDQNKLSDLSYIQFKKLYKERLSIHFKEVWLNSLQLSTKCSLYCNYKVHLKLEKYLTVLSDPLKMNMLRFRSSNHNLPIETGRYINVERKDRICQLCTSHDIGDEYHYLFICSNFKEDRDNFIPKSCIRKPSVFKFCQIMQSKKKSLIVKIAKFAGIIFKKIAIII